VLRVLHGAQGAGSILDRGGSHRCHEFDRIANRGKAFRGEFGIRLEDDVYIAEDGPRWFTKPSPAIDRPFAD
jgi:hypothetical protein